MSKSRERGIVFSGPMVLALLAGRKTVTRRLKCNYRVGDRLYVREPFYVQPDIWAVTHGPQPSHLAADVTDPRQVEDYFLRPGMFMPKWAARLWRGEVTDIREERLQDITEEQAIAEGVTWSKYDDFEAITVGFDEDGNFPATSGKPVTQKRTSGPARIAFYELWNSLYGPEAWAANPVVYPISFKEKGATNAE